MQTNDYLELVDGRNGQFIRLSWKRKVNLAAAYKHLFVEKETTATCRTGIKYENMRMVQEGRANGELPAQNSGLPFGTWSHYPHVITHKGQDYARIYSAENGNLEVNFYLNGKLIHRNQVLNLLTPSDRKKEQFAAGNSTNACFVVKMEDIKQV